MPITGKRELSFKKAPFFFKNTQRNFPIQLVIPERNSTFSKLLLQAFQRIQTNSTCMTQLILILISLVISNQDATNSPLASISFNKEYPDHPMIISALESKGHINQEHIQFILQENESINHKIALIFTLGTKVSSHTNSDLLLSAIKRQYEVQSVYQLNNSPQHAELMACYAYLMGMESTYDVSKALDIAQRAFQFQPNNFAIEFVYRLLQAHQAYGSDYCELFKTLNKLKYRENTNLNPGFLTLALDYAHPFETYCN